MERFRSRSRRRGFSLVEVLLVVAIISLVAAIAVPSVIASLRAAQEARAVANCRSIASAQTASLAHTGRFTVFDALFANGYLGEHFRRGSPGPAEAISDSAYRYRLAFTLNAEGITIDADPEPRHRVSHRWFRCRVGRTVAGRTGGEGTMYVAPAGAYGPSGPASASFALLGG